MATGESRVEQSQQPPPVVARSGVIKMEETTTNKYEMYKELLEIENEDAIQVPRDLHGSLRALKHSLDNPVIIRPPPNSSNRDASTITNKSRTVKTTDSNTLPNRMPVTIPKLAQINEILDHLKERDPRTEIQLNSNNANYNKHYRNVSLITYIVGLITYIFIFFHFCQRSKRDINKLKVNSMRLFSFLILFCVRYLFLIF